MIEEAVNQLVSFLEAFPRSYKLEVIERNHLVVHLDDPDQEKEFTSAIEMIEWLEKYGN